MKTTLYLYLMLHNCTGAETMYQKLISEVVYKAQSQVRTAKS